LACERSRPASLAAAGVRLRLREPLLGELGYFLVLLGRDRQRVSFPPNGPFPDHWPSSSVRSRLFWVEAKPHPAICVPPEIIFVPPKISVPDFGSAPRRRVSLGWNPPTGPAVILSRPLTCWDIFRSK